MQNRYKIPITPRLNSLEKKAIGNANLDRTQIVFNKNMFSHVGHNVSQGSIPMNQIQYKQNWVKQNISTKSQFSFKSPSFLKNKEPESTLNHKKMIASLLKQLDEPENIE